MDWICSAQPPNPPNLHPSGKVWAIEGKIKCNAAKGTLIKNTGTSHFITGTYDTASYCAYLFQNTTPCYYLRENAKQQNVPNAVHAGNSALLS